MGTAWALANTRLSELPDINTTEVEVEEPSELGFKTVFEADGLFYHAARRSYASAEQHEDVKRVAWRDVTRAKHGFEELERRYEQSTAGYREALHEIESLETRFFNAVGRQASDVAATHIFSCSCLEAHIIVLAGGALSGKEFDEFDKLTLRAKWLFLPRICRLPGFSMGEEPFQSFARTVDRRNKLIHHKKTSANAMLIPEYLTNLGLDLSAATSSVEVIPQMVTGLADQFSIETPEWLDASEGLYFGFEFSLHKLGSQNTAR